MKGDGHRGHKLRIRLTLWRRAVEHHGCHSVQAYNRWQKFLEAQQEAVQKAEAEST